MKLFLVVCLFLGSLVASHAAPAAAAAAPNVMALEGKYPDMDPVLKVLKNNEPELSAYLGDPETVCTLFIPSGKAFQDSVRRLGKYAGKAAQNRTLGLSTLNYHIVPGQVLTADQIGSNVTRAMTRANETIYFWREKGKPSAYARPDLPSALLRTDVRAGKCIVHTIDKTFTPPSANNMVEAWLKEIGTLPQLRPKAQWAPMQEPLPNDIVASGKDASSVAPAPKAAAAAAAKSSAGRRHASLVGSVPGLLVLMAAAAAL